MTSHEDDVIEDTEENVIKVRGGRLSPPPRSAYVEASGQGVGKKGEGGPRVVLKCVARAN